jgi:hypothetical protein
LGPDVNRGAVVEQTLHELGVIPGDRYVYRRETAPVGKIEIGACLEEQFGNSEFAVADSIDEGRVAIYGIPHVNFRAMAYQNLRGFYVIIGGSHMKRRDMLAMDIWIRTRFEKDQ